jgi:hypothetical protein
MSWPRGVFLTIGVACLLLILWTGPAFADFQRSNGEPVFQNFVPVPNATGVPVDTVVGVDIMNGGDGVDASTLALTVNGSGVTADVTAVVRGNVTGYRLTWAPATSFDYAEVVAVEVGACSETSGHCAAFSWQFETEADPNLPPFTFVSRHPADGAADVPVDTDIVLEVDSREPIDVSSVAMLVQGAAVTPTVVAGAGGAVISYQPARPFPFGTLVEVEVDLSDEAGASWHELWSFTTEATPAEPLYLANQYPADGAVDVPVDTTIAVDILSDVATVDLSTVRMSVQSQAVTYAADVLANGYHLTLTPDSDFAVGETVDVQVRGCTLAGDCVTGQWSFQIIDMGYVTFARHQPADGDLEATGRTISVKIHDHGFDVSTASIEMYVDNLAVTPSITYGNQGAVVSFPQRAAPGSAVSVEVLVERSGLTFQTAWSFQVMEPPVFADIRPQDGTLEVPLDAAISGRITDSGSGVDADSVALLINGTPVTAVVNPLAPDEVEVAYSFPGGLRPGARYEVSLSACDLAANCARVTWNFQAGAPPVIHPIAPLPGAFDVPLDAAIVFEATDEASGIDESSLTMLVNGQGVSPRLIQHANGDYYRWEYRPTAPFRAGETVAVEVGICDNAGNCVTEAWSFTTVDPVAQGPRLLHPYDGAWLDFHGQQGWVTFAWTEVPGAGAYRFHIDYVNGSFENAMDLGPGDFTRTLGVVLFRFQLDRVAWDYLAQMGGFNWDVTALARVNGPEVGATSAAFLLTFAPTDAVTLLAPDDFAELDAGVPPTFQWNAFPDAEEYLVSFALLGSGGSLIDDVLEERVPGFVTEIPLDQGQWDFFADGRWLWTVQAFDATGPISRFSLRHFTKRPGAGGYPVPFAQYDPLLAPEEFTSYLRTGEIVAPVGHLNLFGNLSRP